MIEGKVTTVAGELPIEIELGATTRYADLQRGEHEVATLDFTRSGPHRSRTWGAAAGLGSARQQR